MKNIEQFNAGVDACKEGWRCPEGASYFFQRGYGMQYAAETSQPPFDLKDYENVIEEICHE